MQDNKTSIAKPLTEEERKKAQKKLYVKLFSLCVMCVIIIVIFTFAWFTYNRSAELSGTQMTAVGQTETEGSVNAYYNANGTWDDLTSENIEFLPGNYVSIKFIFQNKGSTAKTYQLKTDSLKIKYYHLQPYSESDWSADDDGYYGKASGDEGYTKEYVQAGEYYDGETKLDYTKISWNDYMKFLKSSTNAVKYCTTNFETVAGDDADAQLTAAIAKTLTTEQLTTAKNYAKTDGTALCETTANQSLSELSGSEPIDVSNKAAGYTGILSNYKGGSDIGSDGKITLGADSTAVLYMTMYFDPDVYSSADITYDGATKAGVVLKNSNPFMYQYIYLNKMKLEEAS